RAIGPASWSEFISWLGPEAPASHREVRPYVGATLVNGRRTARTVIERFLLTLDADYADGDFLLDVATLLPHPYLVHTTWRHTAENPRYRLIIPLAEGVEPEQYRELARSVMGLLGEARFDSSCDQPERFMWGPSTQGEYV